MEDFLEKILKEKKIEVSNMELEEVKPKRQARNFYNTLANNQDKVQIISEIKRASPSKGDIKIDINPIKQARLYEEGGAAAISVLTDPVFFKGNIEDLRTVAKDTEIPILCKDFIIDEKQLVRARNAGASIVLLIVAALSEDELYKLYTKAIELGLEVLVEVHDKNELEQAEKLGASLIGVNNRNLKTFVVDIDTSIDLAKIKTSDKAFYISESGFKTPADVERVKAEYSAVLVGETLMRSSSPKIALESLQVIR